MFYEVFYGSVEYFVPQEENGYDQKIHKCLTNNGVEEGDKIEIDGENYDVHFGKGFEFFVNYIVDGIKIQLKIEIDKIKVIRKTTIRMSIIYIIN